MRRALMHHCFLSPTFGFYKRGNLMRLDVTIDKSHRLRISIQERFTSFAGNSTIYLNQNPLLKSKLRNNQGCSFRN
jgi:hypothetical protein